VLSLSHEYHNLSMVLCYYLILVKAFVCRKLNEKNIHSEDEGNWKQD
jgi:hypothetical protein